jgi:hypothetical protein
MSNSKKRQGCDEWTMGAERELTSKLDEKPTQTIKALYEGGKLDSQAERELLIWHPQQTRFLRECILALGIKHVVYCATQKQLFATENDLTCVEYFRAMQIIFEHLIDRLMPAMGKHQLAAFLRDVADRLHEEECAGYVAGLIMDSHITDEDRARARKIGREKWRVGLFANSEL